MDAHWTVTFTASDQARWDKKVRKDADGCWRWIGKPTKKGYGSFRVGPAVFPAHRVAYAITNGPIPDGMLVRHRCPGVHTIATRLCVNPAHLEVGTDADNGADKAACGSGRGRVAGEKNGRAKLSDARVAELRRRIDAGENRLALAAEFDISEGHLYHIKRGDGWCADPAKQKRNRTLYQDTELVLASSDIERFWAFVQKSDGCWLWTGCTESGYGAFNVDGRVRAAHRISWLIHGNKLEKGLDIAHECPTGPNRLCVQPEHLAAKTRQGNMANEETRRRLSEANKGNRHRSVLTDPQIRWIKERFRDEPLVTAAQLSRELNGIVCQAAVAKVHKGLSGSHVAVDGFEPLILGSGWRKGR